MIKRRLIPQSLLRQVRTTQPKVVHKSSAQFVDVILATGQRTRINARLLPDDLPTQQEWFRIRIWDDEKSGRSLTG
jgi:hypothetical protein